MNNILKIMKRSFLLLVLAICTIALIGCDNEGTGNKIPDDEYTIPLEEGYNQITFYWTYPGVIENADIWVPTDVVTVYV